MAKAVQLKDKAGNKVYATPYFPIGSIYLTVGNYNPSTCFGGKWEKLTGGYLYATSTGVGQTDYTGWGTQPGGEGNTGSTTLTENQLPVIDGSAIGVLTYSSNSSGHFTSTKENPSMNVVGSGVNHWSTLRYKFGGGQGHNHSLSNHTHKIASVNVFVWKRIA